MNLLGIVLVGFCFTKAIESAPTPCEPQEANDKDCDGTDYEAYRTCIEETKVHREKRQIHPCLPQVIEPVVQTMEPFKMLIPVPPMKVLQTPKLKNLDRKVIVQQNTNEIDEYADGEEGDFHYRLPVNVTTVIRLTNIVNNTNNIHMPTTLNNTNVNNINIYSNLTGLGLDDAPSEKEESCCTAVRPQSCHTSTQGVRCKHRKFQTCGPQCTAKVVHIQQRKRCSRSTGECEEKIAYVPQPEKPTCVYIEEWPYVVCGKQANMSVICAGCYDHYGRGYEAVHGHPRMQPQCYGCYDDAFEMGPLYRRGPVLRPFYYHQPPCYLSGSCPDVYDNCGYGCYGHERIDPAWGQPDMEEYDPLMNSSNTIYYDPDDLEISNEPSADWGVPTAKCAVATDGNTIMLKNCTDSIDNPYLAAPAMHPYYKKTIKSKTTDHSGRPPTSTVAAVAPSTNGATITTTTQSPGTSRGPEVEHDEKTTTSSEHDENAITTDIITTHEPHDTNDIDDTKDDDSVAADIITTHEPDDTNDIDDTEDDGSGAAAARGNTDGFVDDEDLAL